MCAFRCMLHTSILYCVLHCLHITQTYQTCTLYITFVNNWWTVCCLLWLVKTLTAALLGLWKTWDWAGKNPKQNHDWLPRVSKTRIRDCYASLLFWVCCCCNNFGIAPQWVHFFTIVGCLLEEFILGFLLLMLVRKPINQTQARPRIGLPPKFGKNSKPKKIFFVNSGMQFDLCCYPNFHSPRALLHSHSLVHSNGVWGCVFIHIQVCPLH